MDQDGPDWLGRNGGWILVAFGIALVVVGVVFRKDDAIASILAFSGVASVVFGVLLSRLEGSFELGPTKFAATFKAARVVGVRDDLTLEEKANLYLSLFDVRGDEPEAPVVDVEGSEEAIDDVEVETKLVEEPPLPRPTPFLVTGAMEQMHRVGLAFEEHVKRIFAADGWAIERVVLGFDFRATKEHWLLEVEVKLARRWGVADASGLADRLRNRQVERKQRYVLAINSGALSFGSRALLQASGIVVWEVPVEGW